MREHILNVKQVAWTVLFLGLSAVCTSQLQAQEIVSPSAKIRAELKIKGKKSGYGKPELQIWSKNGNSQEIALSAIGLGLQTSTSNLSNALKLVSVGKEIFIAEEYEMLSGKRSHCKNEGTERTFTFQNKKKETLNVVVRVFNDGVAFRYDLENKTIDTLLRENTSYAIENGRTKWMQRYKNDYEGFFPNTTENVSGEWSYPALVEKNKSLYVLISEANITRGNAGSRLDNRKIADVYTVKLGQDKLPLPTFWKSAWRTLIIGSLADVVESTLITDVSEPAKIENTAWIEPGNVAWIYWAYNHSSSDYEKVKSYTDLAAEMGWKYNLIDWKWDQMSNGGNVEDAIKYAQSKGVKPLLWYNSGTGWIGEGAPGPLDRLNTAENRNKEYEWLSKIGVAGVKIDFFDGDAAPMMDYYIDLLEDAAKHKLMVNLHGSTTPRGWSRTYPNLMTMEAVYGAEWYNNNDTLTSRAAIHNVTLPFTRNVIGPMDYTPGTFSDSQHKHITSHGHELALMVAFESAWQHRPDRPSVYRSLPEKVRQVLSELPTVWDDTKLLSGYPGKHIVIARRKGTKWYVAGLNGTDEELNLALDLSSLPGKLVNGYIVKDGNKPDSFTIEDQLDVKSKLSCLARGGFLAVLETESL